MLVNPLLRFLEKLYSLLIKIGSNLQSALLFYMRVTWGNNLFIMGLDKFKNLEETIQFFTTINIPNPTFHAYEVAFIETVCGVMLFLGILSRFAAIPVIFLMISALSSDAHAQYLGAFRFVTDPHILVIQQPYPYLITALLVFIFGPGRISIDAWIKRWLDHQPRY